MKNILGSAMLRRFVLGRFVRMLMIVRRLMRVRLLMHARLLMTVLGSLLLLPLLLGLQGCKKYLGQIPDQSLSVPTTVLGFRELLENDLVTANVTPGLGQLGSDDFKLSDLSWKTSEVTAQNAYVWAQDIWNGQPSLSWSRPYQGIYYCNVVLNGLPGVPVRDSAERVEYNAVWGSALFIRSLLFFYLEETFGAPYRAATADKDWGIILRLNPVPGMPAARSSVTQVYKQLVSDLQSALPLLPAAVQLSHRNRPCRPAAYALLSSVFMCMQDYTHAKTCADSAIRLWPNLVDYNSLDTAAAKPFPVTGSDEVLFQCSAVGYLMQYYYTSEIDSGLFASYAADDLRKKLFFRLTPSGLGHYFKGGYTGKVYLFSGMANDLVYLDRAECFARTGNVSAALDDLNALLLRRWKTGTFRPYTAGSALEALLLILAERRKETLFRECRWIDLRRLNQDPGFAVTLNRVMKDSVYVLAPNDPRYVLPIPEEEILLSGIPQNPR